MIEASGQELKGFLFGNVWKNDLQPIHHHNFNHKTNFHIHFIQSNIHKTKIVWKNSSEKTICQNWAEIPMFQN